MGKRTHLRGQSSSKAPVAGPLSLSPRNHQQHPTSQIRTPSPHSGARSSQEPGVWPPEQRGELCSDQRASGVSGDRPPAQAQGRDAHETSSGAALMGTGLLRLQIGFCHDGFPFLPVLGSVTNRCRSQTTAGYMRVLGRAQLFVAPQTVAHQAPLPMEFSRHEHWSGLPLPSPGARPNSGIKLASLVSPVLAGVKTVHPLSR